MTSQAKHDLSPEIKALLGRLRRRIRAYVWIEGIASVVAVLGLGFWIGLAIDWTFEPSRDFRIGAMTVFALVMLVVIVRSILTKVFARLADTSMAVLLEKYTDAFHDSLLTSVELAQNPQHAATFNQEMLDHTKHEAVDHMPDVRLGDVFNPAPIWRSVIAAVVLAGSVVTFGVFAEESFGFFLGRLQLSEQLWPRRVHLLVDGFPADEDSVRRVKVARGADLVVQIKADNSPEFEIPERVEIRERLDDGSRGRGDAKQIGEALPGVDKYQPFTYTFTKLFDSRTFDVLGEDDRIRDLRIEVVDNPQIIDMALFCEYPKYMDRSDRRLSVTGAMEVPLGTKVRLEAATNKDLVEVKMLDPDADRPAVIDQRKADDLRRFSFELPTLAANKVLYFDLADSDGITTHERDRYRLSLVATADEAPEVSINLKGIGTAITPQARIPVAGKIADDYGINKIWFEHRRDEDEPGTTPLAMQESRRNDLEVAGALEVDELALAPKQKLVLSVKASDYYDLAEAENVGSSQRFLLDVVTPSELRALLERRELILRQRFEAIYEEMTITRDLMATVDFSPPKPAAAEEDDAESESGEAKQPAAKGNAPDGENVEDFSAKAAEQEAATRRKLLVVRSLQNVQRASHEVLAVAVAFDEIREELINNRIDTEEVKRRIAEGISAPLKQIGGPMCGELEKRLDLLDRAARDVEKGPPALRNSIAQADAVLVEMKQVLDRMLELEDYNEVLEQLRAIIKEQQRLIDQTQQERKKKLRNLLDE